MKRTHKHADTSLDELEVSRNQQVGQYENVRAKLEAKESELDAVRLRLADAETSLDELVYFATSRLDNMKRNLQTRVPSSRNTCLNWRQPDYDSPTRRRVWPRAKQRQTHYVPRMLQVP
ncbi:hypothetical protein BGY98DRAFT_242010 [Russula aff. rugulosa BPL654]|nr:hypothetical protein BGY98DRAFT_242010 [Russula aff. rugulosa BPL654]